MPLPLAYADFPAFLLVFVRVLAVIGTMPLFGDHMVPRQVKLGMALLLALILFPTVSAPFAGQVPANILGWMPALFMEALFGAAIGFTARLITTAFEFAGEVAGYMLGLTLAQAVDPQTNLQVPIIGQFLSVLSFMIFLAINAHHILIGALVTSFDALPPFSIHIGGGFATLIIGLVFELFKLGLQVSAPVVAAILLANVGLGVISRAVPQMHVLVVAMPLTIAMGLLVIGLSLPYVTGLMVDAYGGMGDQLAAVTASMRG